jgi:hypothetical protein
MHLFDLGDKRMEHGQANRRNPHPKAGNVAKSLPYVGYQTLGF